MRIQDSQKWVYVSTLQRRRFKGAANSSPGFASCETVGCFRLLYNALRICGTNEYALCGSRSSANDFFSNIFLTYRSGEGNCIYHKVIVRHS